MKLNHIGRIVLVKGKNKNLFAGPVYSMWLFLFLFSCLLSFAQKNTTIDSVVHFKVKYSNGDYKFFPADNYLFVGSQNKIKITNTKGKYFEVKLTNGSIKKIKGDSVYEIDGLVNMGNTLLSIYEKDVKGKKRIVLNKPFTVVAFPTVKFAGVRSDSAMPTIMLAAGSMYADYKSINKKIPVTSFKMEFYENEKFTLDSSLNNRLSKKMLAYVEKLKPGSLIYLTDIKYKTPNGGEKTEPIYRVFIIKEDEVLQFGW